MDLPHLIVDVEACVADGEWERADAYLEDLRRGLEEHLSAATSPRNAGAIVATLRGIEGAVQRHDAQVAAGSLRHLEYCCSDRIRDTA